MLTLDKLLKPKSVAVIGASQRPFRAGSIVMQNLLSGGFQGTIMPVTPKYQSVSGVLAYSSIDQLPLIPDLSIICTKAKYNKAIFTELAAKGAGAVIVISSDMYQSEQDSEQSIDEECLAIARQSGMRVLGSNSLGLILPWVKLNASLSPVTASQGSIAFISQSAAVCTTILDWATDKQIGFSAFVSLGNAVDIDFPELLDSLSVDSKTSAILLYVDSIKDARAFMSAARSASRNRRILVLKSGRSVEGQQAASLHTRGKQSIDIIYDSAIKRSGMLRVNNTHELFAALETLTHSVPLRGERLAIMTNGGGPGIMAVDELIHRGGKLATLTEETIEQLNQILPPSWSHSNPIDLVGDADSQRYAKAMDILLDSDAIDAILVMHSPSAISHPTQTANTLIEKVKNHKKSRCFNILTNWSGETTAKEARSLFTQAGIPTYRTPEGAVGAYMHLVEYRRNQKQLMETPSSVELRNPEQLLQAQSWIQSHLQESTSLFDSHQIDGLLKSYNISVLPTWLASDASEAVHISEKIGYPVAVKLRSPDIVHKSEVQGVMLNLRNANEVASATQAIMDRTSLLYPSALIHGVSVQSMASRAGSQELRIRIETDPIFGPVIMLGQGGTEWDVTEDASVALLPLNMALARYLVIRAMRVGKLRLEQLPNPVDTIALCELLVRLSQMVIDNSEILSLDLHPLLAAGNEFTVIDARLELQAANGNKRQRLAIKPYPVEHEEMTQLKNGQRCLVRPVLPEDEEKMASFITQVSREDLYKRFFSDVGEFNHEALANLTQIDYDREMAFVATQINEENQEILLGVARVIADSHNYDAEFSILIRSDLKGIGLGRLLMEKLIAYSQTKGTVRLTGITMPSNKGMVQLAKKLNFKTETHFEDNIVDMLLIL
ncbi:bifunctional acetate--CoA ligase family protein/GNAT family N-acetyltransferase [Vibrio algivorus]|uniref:Protein lysine acetyltransferase n=1 Tax=Vibrio algivorus TaxID=1667024 RepID=A0ABQ6EP11_9VIBR|nr:bifunctional acetate--CoA ligase family protein/GNAT family N-acetyltransferase [Vibrio algivorus]GLT14570.1 protein lysine acetyltransferase [Vibrio algivorus]